MVLFKNSPQMKSSSKSLLSLSDVAPFLDSLLERPLSLSLELELLLNEEELDDALLDEEELEKDELSTLSDLSKLSNAS